MRSRRWQGGKGRGRKEENEVEKGREIPMDRKRGASEREDVGRKIKDGR